MSAFTLDIKGQLNNMRLSESKSLWPLLMLSKLLRIPIMLTRAKSLFMRKERI